MNSKNKKMQPEEGMHKKQKMLNGKGMKPKLMECDLTKIKARHTAAKAERIRYDTYIDTAYRFTIPQRRIYLEAQNKLRPTPEIYDDTAVLALNKFATKMQSLLIPTQQKWMQFETGSDISEEDKEAQQLKYDKDTKVFFEQIEKSNFEMQATESFQDLGVSTGALVINPAPPGSDAAISFKAIPLSELSFEAADDGLIRNVWREYDIPLTELQEKHPGAQLSKDHLKAMENDPTKKITIVEAVIYSVLTNSYMVHIYESGTEHIFTMREEKTQPIVVFRENVVSGAAFGFGRALRVLPTIKALNKLKQSTLQSIDIAVNGVFTAHDDGILNPYTVRLRPGLTIPVNSNDVRNPSISRLDTTSNLDAGIFEAAEMRANINETFLANPLGAINETPVRSATEIAARNSEIFQTMSSSLGRMQREFIAPTIKRVTDILQRAGKVSEFNLDGNEVTYKFISPFARLQTSAEVENILEWLGIVGTLGEEIVNLTVKVEDVPHYLAKQYGIPQELLRSKEEAVGAQEEAAAQQQQQQMAAGGQDMAGGILPQEISGPSNTAGLDGLYA